jgi:hypothetical protein
MQDDRASRSSKLAAALPSAPEPWSASDQIALALVRLRLETRARDSEQIDIEAQMAAYLDRLKEYPLTRVLEVLKRWPNESPWWPSWHELAERLPKRSMPQPRELPEHRLLNGPRQDDSSLHRPFTPAERRDFDDAMAALRDPNVPMLARASLLAMGKQIEARQCKN